MSKNSILVVGSLAYDSIQTPSGVAEKTLGGSANYFSLAASLFAPVRVVGVIGNDYGKEDLARLTSRNVDTSGLSKMDGKTFHWAGKYEGDLNEAQTLKTELNVFEFFDPKIPEAHKSSEFVFLANISPDLQIKVLEQVNKPIMIGMDTMNFWINSKIDYLKQLLPRVDVVLINEGEAKQLSRAPNAVAAAPAIVALGPKVVVIKRGEFGFLLYTKEEGYFSLPAFPVAEVVDPTGAGDTFAGGFFGYLAGLGRKPEIKDIHNACLRGSILASFTIQNFGVTSLEKISLQDLESRLTKYHRVIGW